MKNDITTKLIVFMTFAFFIAEAPLGTIYLVKVFSNRDDEIFLFSIDIIIYFVTLNTLNSISHSMFCLIMSSQYRNTILTLPQILISFLTYQRNFYSYPTRLLGFQESCILSYMFIYAVPLAKSKRVIKWFNKMNIHPNGF
ncbi:unnamed protein product [Caenorhabditis nigoni]